MEIVHQQKELISGIKEGQNVAIKQVYETAFKYCASYIIRNKGTINDAKDIFQEALIVLIKNLRKEGFEIKYDLKSYLYTITRNLWLKKLRTDKKSGLNLLLDDPNHAFVPVIDKQLEEKAAAAVLEEKHQLLYTNLKKLKADCRQLLKLTFFEKTADKAIAEIMGFSYQFVRQKRKRCVNKLKEFMAA